MAATLNSISTRFTTKSQLEKLESFVDKQKGGGLLQNSLEILTDAVKNVELNLIWDQEKLVHFRDYMEKRYNASNGLWSSWILVMTGLVTTFIIRLGNIAII